MSFIKPLYFEKGSATRVSQYFIAREFDCRCERKECRFTLISPDLLELLDAIRHTLDRPVIINSGYRCEPHNRESGGSKGSTHMVGRGADIRSPGVSGQSLLAIAEQVGVRSIGVAKKWIHVDDRSGFRRWKY